MPTVSDEVKKRLRRSFARRRREAVDSVSQADQNIEKLLIKRFDRLVSVRRFVALWIALFVLLFFCVFLQIRALSPYYQSLQPVPGGLYSEGVIGSFSNANPLYATGAADTAVSRLIFSGLFKYNDSNQLTGDLATSYSLNDSQTVYTVHLRHNVRWQDGQPFTADDVVYTYKTIQDIAAQSPLYVSWQGITVTKQDNYTVTFDLPNALSSFPNSLTNGIVPKHLLGKLTSAQLRSAAFNTDPIGTGPFVWKFIEVTGSDAASRQQRISLSANGRYWAGPPKIDGFSLITYSDDQHVLRAFEQKQLNAISGLDTIPAELTRDSSVQFYQTPLTAEVDTFFNMSKPIFSDVNVRKALVEGVDRSQLSTVLGSPVKIADSPLLRGQLGYDPTLTEAPYNLASANQILDAAGWARDSSGMRSKGGQPLSFILSTQNSADYTKVAQFLQSQWAKLGVKVEVSYYESDDLQTSVIGNHSYDALLYGINIGVDPDVYAYWDSSQASITSQGHLNLSEYKSSAADAAIEAGRTRADPTIRAIKYKAFLSAWVSDQPALTLYQPNYLYITRGPVYGYERKADNSSLDRFYNVADWEIRQQKQTIK